MLPLKNRKLHHNEAGTQKEATEKIERLTEIFAHKTNEQVVSPPRDESVKYNYWPAGEQQGRSENKKSGATGLWRQI